MTGMLLLVCYVLVDVFFPACAGVSNKATAKNIPHAIAVIFTFVSMFNMY